MLWNAGPVIVFRIQVQRLFIKVGCSAAFNWYVLLAKLCHKPLIENIPVSKKRPSYTGQFVSDTAEPCLQPD